MIEFTFPQTTRAITPTTPFSLKGCYTKARGNAPGKEQKSNHQAEIPAKTGNNAQPQSGNSMVENEMLLDSTPAAERRHISNPTNQNISCFAESGKLIFREQKER